MADFTTPTAADLLATFEGMKQQWDATEVNDTPSGPPKWKTIPGGEYVFHIDDFEWRDYGNGPVLKKESYGTLFLARGDSRISRTAVMRRCRVSWILNRIC